jgi:alpha-beta hydrolase superfamily lysophospholipase
MSMHPGRMLCSLVVLVLAATCFAQPFPESMHVDPIDEQFDYDEAAPMNGHWLGNVVNSAGSAVPASLLVEPAADVLEDHTVTFTCIPAMAMDLAARNVMWADGELAFDLALGARPVRFVGRFSDDGQRFEGTLQREGEGDKGSFVFHRTPRVLDLPLPLAFSGDLPVPGGSSMPMTIAVAKTPGGHWVGHIDSPIQTIFGAPLIHITAEPAQGKTTFTAFMMGVRAKTTFTMHGGERITGIWAQGPYELAFDMPRDHGYAGGALNRPQRPTPPYPYETRHIVVSHPDGHVLAGTLTIPDPKRFGTGPHPAAILISGSGQQDRDETIMGHKPFLVIADALTQRGIAVMRYDDRGVAESAVENPESLMSLTTADSASDTAAVFRHLATIDDIDAKRIGLIGHSEGGLIAPMVASEEDKVAYIVMLAGPGVRGVELLARQISLLSLADGAEPELTERLEVLATGLFNAVAAGAEGDELTPHWEKYEAVLEEMGNESVRENAEQSLAQLTLPWMRWFLAHDPRPVIAQLDCPILALNGKKDLQVDWSQNLPEIDAAGRDVSTIAYDDLNHLFQPCETGAVSEYVEIETTIDERVLRDVGDWIRRHVGLED